MSFLPRKNYTYLAWFDVEFTSLKEEEARILEIALVLTDSSGIEAGRYHGIVHQSESVLENMSDWCKETFGYTHEVGTCRQESKIDIQPTSLIHQVRISTKTEDDVDRELSEFIKTHAADDRPLYPAGINIHVDYNIVKKYFPNFSSRLGYQFFDLTTILRLAQWHYPETFTAQPRLDPRHAHRAIYDIDQTIRLYTFYLSNLLPTSQRRPPLQFGASFTPSSGISSWVERPLGGRYPFLEGATGTKQRFSSERFSSPFISSSPFSGKPTV
jgi:oligoribonuclease